MKLKHLYLGAVIFLLVPFSAFSQIDEDQPGAWYMYFWNTKVKEGPWGFQGDIQHRNWNILGDLEQLFLRGGVTYQPEGTQVKFTLGYGYISTGDFGPSDYSVSESRIYQETLLPQNVGGQFYLTHLFRYEQRFVELQDMRTRFRYNFFINVLFNKKDLSTGAIYLALYNELFINGERSTGQGSVELFDRNRAYVALGHSVAENLRAQLGFMQQTTDKWSKGQLQVSLHHNFGQIQFLSSKLAEVI